MKKIILKYIFIGKNKFILYYNIKIYYVYTELFRDAVFVMMSFSSVCNLKLVKNPVDDIESDMIFALKNIIYIYIISKFF